MNKIYRTTNETSVTSISSINVDFITANELLLAVAYHDAEAASANFVASRYHNIKANLAASKLATAMSDSIDFVELKIATDFPYVRLMTALTDAAIFNVEVIDATSSAPTPLKPLLTPKEKATLACARRKLIALAKRAPFIALARLEKKVLGHNEAFA